MDEARRLPDAPQETEPQTLGGLLYASRSRAAMSERDWVNLIGSIASGNQAALHTVYEHTCRIVFTLVVRITKSRETAEEVTLDVFHDVWRKAAAYQPGNGSVVGWIMNQARSRAIDRIRFDQRQKRVGTDVELPPPIPAADPQQALQSGERDRLLIRALDALSAAERQAIESAFFAELSYKEVATQLNEPLGTIKSRIRSGLTKLRNALDGEET